MLIYKKVFQCKFSCDKRETSTFIFLKGDSDMGISYRKRIKIGKNTFVNISKSGVSVSLKVGKITINSKGRMTVNLGNGVIYRTSLKKK